MSQLYSSGVSGKSRKPQSINTLLEFINMYFGICFVSYPDGIRFFLCETLALGFAKDKAYGRVSNPQKNHVKVYKFNLYDTLPNFFENQNEYLIKTFN